MGGAAGLTMPSPSYSHGKKPSRSSSGTEDRVWGPQLEISLGRAPPPVGDEDLGQAEVHVRVGRTLCPGSWSGVPTLRLKSSVHSR